MRQKLHTIVMVILAVIFAGCLGMVIYNQLQTAASARSIEEARRMALMDGQKPAQTPSPAPGASGSDPVQGPEEPAPPPEPEKTEEELLLESLQVDLEALREVNKEVAGWVLIPGTEVSYPLVRGEDNDYYLNHGWDRQHNRAGAIFMDYTCSIDLSDPYTILYGHNMKDGSMFRTLWRYREQEFWEEHPRVYLFNDDGLHRYDIFSVWEPSASSETFHPDQLADDQLRQKLTGRSISYSAIDSGLTPEASERILALSTCSGSGYSTRWVVFAVERALETGGEHEE